MAMEKKSSLRQISELWIQQQQEPCLLQRAAQGDSAADYQTVIESSVCWRAVGVIAY